MRKLLIFSLVLIFFNLSCSKNSTTDSTGTIIKLTPLWSAFTSDRLIGGTSIKETILYDNGIVVSSNQNYESALLMLDVNTGIKKWMWQENLLTYTRATSFSLDFPIISGGNLICNQLYFNVNIDLKTGKTVWKNEFIEYSYDKLNNFFNSTIYCGNQGFYNSYTKKPVGVYVLNMKTGTPEFILPVKIDTTNTLSDSGYSGETSCVYPFINNQDTLLSLIVTDPPMSGYKYRLTTSLYNASKHTWIYERIPLFNVSNEGVSGKPIVFGNNLYVCSAGESVCFNMLTGERKWATNFTDGNRANSFSISTPLLADNKIFFQNENSYLYCLDPNTGATIWKQSFFGSRAHMAYLNGIVYVISGGDGELYAFDASNGNKLWAIPSPDLNTNSSAIFDGYVGVVPPQNGQKGKIVVTTGLNAYCYEAYK